MRVKEKKKKEKPTKLDQRMSVHCGKREVGGLSGKHESSNISFIGYMYISDKGTR